MADKRVVRCKMRLVERAERKFGPSAGDNGVSLKFQVVSPINSDHLTAEDREFFKWSPFGSLEVGTINFDAAKAMQLDGEYYVDITKAD